MQKAILLLGKRALVKYHLYNEKCSERCIRSLPNADPIINSMVNSVLTVEASEGKPSRFRDGAEYFDGLPSILCCDCLVFVLHLTLFLSGIAGNMF